MIAGEAKVSVSNCLYLKSGIYKEFFSFVVINFNEIN